MAETKYLVVEILHLYNDQYYGCFGAWPDRSEFLGFPRVVYSSREEAVKAQEEIEFERIAVEMKSFGTDDFYGLLSSVEAFHPLGRADETFLKKLTSSEVWGTPEGAKMAREKLIELTGHDALLSMVVEVVPDEILPWLK